MNIFSDDCPDIRIVSLVEWLDWAAGKAKDVFLALPMIQRGLVWQPHQIIDLWDSLLQGMPIGSMLVSELPAGTPVRRPGKREREEMPPGGGLALIDGHQRTLAMLVAWPRIEERDLRIWVDFADEPAPGHLLRLRVTTRNQPFGFQRDAPSSKLSLNDRRTAREAFDYLHNPREALESPSERQIEDGLINKILPSINNAQPFSHRPRLPVDLRTLIYLWRRKRNRDDWITAVNKFLRSLQVAKSSSHGETVKWSEQIVWELLNEPVRTKVREHVEKLANALRRLESLKMPLIRVGDRFFETDSTDGSDPPLAVLFKRIGAGGTRLSDADYVYSVIKHLRSETYDLVETLLDARNVASLLTATDLVMSAVRLAAVTWKPEDGKTVPDMESPNKQEFHRLLKRGDFISKAFLPLIKPSEQGINIACYFVEVQSTLLYRKSTGTDTGLPKQAFPLLKRPLVQVLLRLAQVGYLNNGAGETHRNDVLRLVLFWLVAVSDAPKASGLAYEVIKKECCSGEKCDPNVELGRAIHDRLIAGRVAVRLPAPEDIRDIPGLVFSRDSTKLLRGMSRFDFTTPGEFDVKKTAERYLKKYGEEGFTWIYDFYRKNWWGPWNYQHPILLWLQREMVANKLDKTDESDSDVNKTDPMAGKDEDTPYDYDHILPYAHWGNWTGVTSPDTLRNFAEVPKQISVVGNAIGNIRVWPSSFNRSDSDSPPMKKLARVKKPDELEENVELDENALKYSAIRADKINHWKEASGNGKPRSWNSARAVAFQNAVEERTFYLYQCYFDELGFAEWPYRPKV